MLQHDVNDTATRNSDQGKAWPPNTPGAQEAEDDIQQQTPTPKNNTHGLGDQIHSSNEVTKVHNEVHIHQFQNTIFLRDTRDITTHMVFEDKLVVKLHAKNIEVGTIANGTPDKTKSPWGGFTVQDLLTTIA